MQQLAKLRVDSLERRDVPAASPVISATFANGILTVNATNNNDNVVVQQTATTITVPGVTIRNNGVPTGPLSARLVRLISVYTYNGNDFVDLRQVSATTRVLTGFGNDQVFGGQGTDQIYGEGDNDILRGFGRNDLIVGGDGNDQIFGDDGNDELYGDNGNGGVFGGLDTIFGGRGNDFLFGEGNNDVLYANDTYQTLLGEFNFAVGGAGRDAFYYFTRGGVAGVFAAPISGNRFFSTGALDALTYEAVFG